MQALPMTLLNQIVDNLVNPVTSSQCTIMLNQRYVYCVEDKK